MEGRRDNAGTLVIHMEKMKSHCVSHQAQKGIPVDLRIEPENLNVNSFVMKHRINEEIKKTNSKPGLHYSKALVKVHKE